MPGLFNKPFSDSYFAVTPIRRSPHHEIAGGNVLLIRVLGLLADKGIFPKNVIASSTNSGDCYFVQIDEDAFLNVPVAGDDPWGSAGVFVNKELVLTDVNFSIPDAELAAAISRVFSKMNESKSLNSPSAN